MINVTVNGVPVEVIVDDEIRDEININRVSEVVAVKHSIAPHIITKKIRNTSGCRSGRGRVIYSVNAGGAQ